MSDLVLIALAGFAASVVDGALGMGFGPTSATILLSSGISPAATSTMVNIAKVATGAVGGYSHWRFGNVDRRLVLHLAVPGACGAVLGATIVVRRIPARLLGIAVAALLLLTQTRELLRAGTIPAAPLVVYGTVAVAVGFAAVRPRVRRIRLAR